MQVTVWGGAGEHGRSCYLIEHRQTRVLLDCGVKKEGPGAYPSLVGETAAGLDAVFLSHAHEDHSVAIPLLYKLGYRGAVWTTRATVRQLPAYFRAWKQYVAAQGAPLPYEEEHIDAIQYAYLEETAGPGEWLALSPKLSVCWGRSGHLPGSVWLLLNIEGRLAFFSGDYTSESALLAADIPALPAAELRSGEEAQPALGGAGRSSARANGPTVDLAIVDAAYGGDPDSQGEKLALLKAAVGEALHRGETVLLPVPVFGRGQELLLWAQETFPDVRIVAEKEIVDGLADMLQWRAWLRENAAGRIARGLQHGCMTVVDDPAGRERAIGAAPAAAIVFTSDGMMQSAKCRWYYEVLKRRGGYRVILTGHLAQGSLGRRLITGQDGGVGDPAARFVRYKVHQGKPDVRAMLDALPSKETVLVHAGKETTDALSAELAREGYAGLHSLVIGDALQANSKE
ncbi:MBL fold metallo-hydrolase [Paenibacillus doosanensis]|uniref:MBL fold metallo-hydrolase n=1 Tax=Paenibacillus doosanensis TaxID=1229154 RepID=UPI0021801253|nr:MBL fold metallo-hydrolase [Paenibacillus doosanensis]MCS7463837.1 MBL fold metallo-hydrolase [Paenibacillus doosanensis]